MSGAEERRPGRDRSGRRSGRAAAAAGLLALCGVVGIPAHAAAPNGTGPLTKAREIDALLDGWRFREADAALAELKRTAPKAPELPYLEGYQKFLLGDYAGAVTLLDGAVTASQSNADVKALRDLAAEARDATKEHREIGRAHV